MFTPRAEGGLRRSLGLGQTVGLGLNGVIGSGIFLLPGEVAAQMGPASILATVCAGVLCLLIALCYAEVGSRFSGTGGAYLYARAAFGDFVGFEVAWMMWAARVVSWAALANGVGAAVADVLGGLPPGGVKAIAAATVVVLGVINWANARAGAAVSSAFALVKLLPLALFVGVGAWFVQAGPWTPFAPHGAGRFGESVLTILWAYVGFEALAIPAGEMRDPGRILPRALFATLGVATAVYLAVQAVAIGTFPALAGSPSPVAEAARGFLGPAAAGIVAMGVVVSIFGTAGEMALTVPRTLYALAVGGQLPASLATVHPRRATPTVAVAVSALIALGIALTGSFAELAVISVVARFSQYLPTCLAVLVLRRRDPTPPPFRLPWGPVIPLAALLAAGALVASAPPSRLGWGVVALGVGAALYALVGRGARRA